VGTEFWTKLNPNFLKKEKTKLPQQEKQGKRSNSYNGKAKKRIKDSAIGRKSQRQKKKSWEKRKVKNSPKIKSRPSDH